MEGWMNGRRPEYCMFYRLACYLLGVWNDSQFRTIRYGTGVYTGRRTCVRACMRMYMYLCILLRSSSSSALGITLGISLHLWIAYLRQKVQGRSFCQEYSE